MCTAHSQKTGSAKKVKDSMSLTFFQSLRVQQVAPASLYKGGKEVYLFYLARFSRFITAYFFLLSALSLSDLSRIVFLKRIDLGVTSKSSSSAKNSILCSSERVVGGTSFNASSEPLARVFVTCFFLHTLQNDVLVLSALTDNHTFIYFNTRTYKKTSSILSVPKTVACRSSCFVNND